MPGIMKKGMMYQEGGPVKPPERKRRVLEGGPKGMPMMTREQSRMAREMETPEERRERTAPMTARELEGMSSRFKKGGMVKKKAGGIVKGGEQGASESASVERDATERSASDRRASDGRFGLKNLLREAEGRANLFRKALKMEGEQSGNAEKFKKGGVVKKAKGGMISKGKK